VKFKAILRPLPYFNYGGAENDLMGTASEDKQQNLYSKKDTLILNADAT